MIDKKVQWHPGFVAAMSLELAKDRDNLVFEKEYNLNTKPLEIDLLVIKKDAGIQLDNEIGKIFRGHNIMEYKSPEDQLDVDAFYKAGAYAGLYKSYGEMSDGVKADDITVSLVREAKPEGLFRYFDEHGYKVSNPYSGIYYVEGNVLFPTQIVVTKELEWETHMVLRALSDRLKKQEMKEFVTYAGSLTEKLDKEYIDSVLQVSMQANRRIAEELKGDDGMCEALLELMEPELMQRYDERKKEGKIEGKKEGIHGAVDILRGIGQEEENIRRLIKEKYALTDAEVAEYL